MRKISLYILIAIIVIIGGYLALNKYQENKLVEEAQKEAELFVRRNYEDIHDIHDVHVNKDNTFFNPMGGLSIGGHVNDNDSLYFNIRFNITNKKVGNVTSVFSPQNFPPEKEGCKDNFCQ